MTTPSSSSSFGSTLIICLVASLITPSSSNYLSQMCIKSNNPRFCLQVFGLNSHKRPYELTQEALNLTFTNATETTEKIHFLIEETKDGNLKVIYNVCSNYYQSAIDVLLRTNEYYLKEAQYSNVHEVGKLVKEVAFNCEIEFQTIPGYPYVSTLSKENEDLGNFGSIIVSAVNLLFIPPSF